jgi:DNA topoisomerase-1
VGRQLVPTFKAFMAMEILQGNFEELMDLGFTARMDEALDEISEGKADSKTYLKSFFMGEEGKEGLKPMVDDRKGKIPFPHFHVGEMPETGEPIIVRNGRDGNPFLQIGDASAKRYANVPEDLAPADLTVEKALELLEQKAKPAESIGVHPVSGRNLMLKQRQGYYIEVERTPEEIEAKERPTWVSLPPDTDPHSLSKEDLDFLCLLPKEIGVHAELKLPILFKVGKFGAYIECGTERRTVDDWRKAMNMTVPEAAELLSRPKFQSTRTSLAAVKEFGALEGAAGPVKVMSGRFGPYVTDGETNATLPKGTDPATLEAQTALSLLAAKRAAGPSKRFSRTAAKKKPAIKAAKVATKAK